MLLCCCTSHVSVLLLTRYHDMFFGVLTAVVLSRNLVH
jgi:hypothetical protein